MNRTFASLLAAITLAATAAAAQGPPSYLNQTTCVSGTCITGGALQMQNVDCSAGQKISTALASMTDRNGPNIINLSGTCNEPMNIVGFNRLTVAGSATLMQPVNINGSGNISLNDLTIAGPNGLFVGASTANITNVTVRNSNGHGIVVAGGSNLLLNGIAPGNVITNNAFDGINIGPGSSVGIGGNETITSNGWSGVAVHDGGQANITSGNVNGVVDISNNGESGVQAELQSSVYLRAIQVGAGGSPMIHIHGNGSNGVEIIASTGVLEGNVVVENNTPDHDPLFGGAVAVAGGVLAINPGVQISGGSAGIIANVQSKVVLGDSSMAGLSTITGGTTGVSLLNGSMVLGLGPNTISSIECDATSWTSGSYGTVVGGNSCGDGAPTGLVGPTGPAGPAGPAGSAVSGSLLFLIEGSAEPSGYVRVGSYREERVDLDAPGGAGRPGS